MFSDFPLTLIFDLRMTGGYSAKTDPNFQSLAGGEAGSEMTGSGRVAQPLGGSVGKRSGSGASMPVLFEAC